MRCHATQNRVVQDIPSFAWLLNTVDSGSASSSTKPCEYKGFPTHIVCGLQDPGNLESDLQAGAHAGYSLLWMFMWSTMMVRTHALIHVPCHAVLCHATLCCAVLCLSVHHVMFNESSPPEGALAAAQGYIMQMLAAKLGVATGKHLAEHCRQALPFHLRAASGL